MKQKLKNNMELIAREKSVDLMAETGSMNLMAELTDKGSIRTFISVVYKKPWPM